jgi:hypothetical protein
MMFALYVVLGWSLTGFVAALLFGRAIAICNGEQQDAELVPAGQPVRAQKTKTVSAARAA